MARPRLRYRPGLEFLEIRAVPAIYYVAPNGDDGAAGSLAAPWAHVQYAIDQTAPGDSVLVRAGTYHEYLEFNTSGAPGQPITLAAYPSEAVTLSGAGLSWRYGIDLRQADYITLENLTIQDYIRDGERGFGVGGEGGNDGLVLRGLDISLVGTLIKLQGGVSAISHNVLIENLSGHGYDAAGIDVGPEGSIDGLTIRSSTLTGPGVGDNTAVDGIAVEAGQNITVEDVIVTGHPGDGIDLKADNVSVRRVTSTAQSRNGIKLWGQNVLLENSIALNNGLTSLVLKGLGPYTLSHNLLGNTTQHDYSAVLGDYDNPTHPTQVIANANVWVSTAGQTGALVYLVTAGTFSGDHNVYFAPNQPNEVVEWRDHGFFSSADITSGAWTQASGADAHGVYADPLLGADLHLQAGSPALDLAQSGPALDRDGHARPVGAGYDAGPYEAGSVPGVGVTVSSTGGLVTTEGGGTATFTVVLNTLPSADVTIALSSSNTAEGTVSPSSLTFTPAHALTPQTVTVTGVDDNAADGPVAFTIVTGAAASTDAGYHGVDPSDVSVTNADDDPAEVVQFSAATFSVGEDSGSVALSVLRTGTGAGVTVSFIASAGEATAGQDYSAASGMLSFAAGETEKQLTITISNDNLVEADSESFQVTLHDPAGGATLGAAASATVSIVDDDLPQVPDATLPLQRLQQAALLFGKSDEHYRDFVSKAYHRFLGRSPDDEGLHYWVTLMHLYETSQHTQGLSQEQLEAGFLTSSEYQGRYGGVGEAWVRGIYRDLLGREAEPAGVDYWMSQLAQDMPPAQVALGFTTSQERLHNRVTDLYWTFLGRAPEQAGLDYWMALFQLGHTTEDVVSGFVGSLEYYAASSRGGGNPARWTRTAYLDVLFRPATVAEFDYWLQFLAG